MFDSIVYVLCFLTSGICAWLLLSSYARYRQRLLLWSALCFCALALNSLLVFADIIVFPDPDIDLLPLRQATNLLAIGFLIYGFIWEAD
jgi:hypothetical protein